MIKHTVRWTAATKAQAVEHPAPASPWAELRDKARKAIAKARPVTNAVERVANMAVHLRNGITPIGAIGLVSAAMNSLGSDSPCAPASGRSFCCSMGTTAAALSVVGWTVKDSDKEGRWTKMRRSDLAVHLCRDGDVYEDSGPGALAAVEAALDAFLPRALRISHAGEQWVDAPAEMQHFQTDHGAEIARLLTMHAADGPRCVLLKGRPGTGKTTIAREIVTRLNAGRALFLDESAFGHRNGSAPRLSALRPRVIVADDIDKIATFGCGTVEELRAAAPFVILTANNGDLDAVIDGAMGRPGRIDEVFPIDAEPFPREAPFDLLTDEEWSDVQSWPVASVNELRRRLELRGRDGMRLDDLRDRVSRRVRSGDVLA